MRKFTIVLGLSTVLSAPALAITLDDAYHSALSRGEAIRQGEQQVIQMDEQIDQVVGGVLPNLSFNASHTIQPLPNDPIAQQFSPRHQTTANFTLTQPLFRGFREFAGLRQAKHLYAASRDAQAWNTTLLYSDVAEVYLNVLSLEQDLKNLEDQLGLYESRIKELGARSERGESSESEVLSAQSTYSTLEAEVRLIQGQLRVAREKFHFLTALPQNSTLVDPEVLADVKNGVGPLDKYLTRVDSRLDVKSAKENFEASDNDVTIQRGGHWPTIDAVGNYYLIRPGFLSDLKWDVGVRLTFPLFEGGATESKVRSAIAKRMGAELEVSRTRRAAIQQIRSLHERLGARLDHMKKLERSVELSEKNSVLMQRDYRRGLVRNIDVQLALTELRNARRSYDQSRFAGQLEMYQLKVAAALAPVEPKGTK